MAALLLLCAAPAPAKNDKQRAVHVRCGGINACKGQGACSGKNSSCAGTNACKGQGWVLVTDQECREKNGVVLE